MVSASDSHPAEPHGARPSAVLIILNVFFAFLLLAILSFLQSLGRRASVFFMANSSPKKLDISDAVAELRKIRESGVRDSRRVVELWYSSISRQLYMLGHEKWCTLEQVFIAALDVSDETLALECLDRLRAQFPKSSRVNRLFGLYLEKQGRFDDAHALYTQLLNDDPTNTLARKRMIAMLIAQRKTTEAIDGLRQYLNTFMSDFEAWNELVDLYLSEGDYKHAAFCMEEVLLSNPHNHLYCQRYAEIKYTEGGTENLELARTYFAQSCHLNPSNLRSLYGLLLTCSALDSQLSKNLSLAPLSSSGKSNKAYTSLPSSGLSNSFPLATSLGPERNRLLAQWASRQIRHIYEAGFMSKLERKLQRQVSMGSSRAGAHCTSWENHLESTQSTSTTEDQMKKLDVQNADSMLRYHVLASDDP